MNRTEFGRSAQFSSSIVRRHSLFFIIDRYLDMERDVPMRTRKSEKVHGRINGGVDLWSAWYRVRYLARKQMGTMLIVPINNNEEKPRSRWIRKKKKRYFYMPSDISCSDRMKKCVCWRVPSARTKPNEENQPNSISFVFISYPKQRTPFAQIINTSKIDRFSLLRK